MGASKKLFEQVRNNADQLPAQRKTNDAKRATSRKKGAKFNTIKK